MPPAKPLHHRHHDRPVRLDVSHRQLLGRRPAEDLAGQVAHVSVERLAVADQFGLVRPNTHLVRTNERQRELGRRHPEPSCRRPRPQDAPCRRRRSSTPCGRRRPCGRALRGRCRLGCGLRRRLIGVLVRLSPRASVAGSFDFGDSPRWQPIVIANARQSRGDRRAAQRKRVGANRNEPRHRMFLPNRDRNVDVRATLFSNRPRRKARLLDHRPTTAG